MTMNMAELRGSRILVVDDEKLIRESLVECLVAEGMVAIDAASGEEAVELAGRKDFDLVLCDLQLPGISGIDTLEKLLRLDPGLMVLLMTAYGTVDTAVSAFQRGAQDYLVKPIQLDELFGKLCRLIEQRTMRLENQGLRLELRMLEDVQSARRLVGSGPAMQVMRGLLARVGPTRSTVLIQGESGTGKELVARALHELGERKRDPDGRKPGRFLAVNCAAIPAELLENQLFGHRKGAFTGADRDQPGLFVHAGPGTVFLDEIAEMPLLTQAKLLRAIEEKEVLPVGASEPVRVEARILAATNKELRAEVTANRFREDLYYRLNIVTLTMPPLRDRREDIPELAEHLLARHARTLSSLFTGIGREAMRLLVSAQWKGNVRELDNVLERAAILGDGPLVQPADLPPDLRQADDDPDAVEGLVEAVRRFEKRHLERMLALCSDEAGVPDKKEAAKRLGIALSSLYRRLGELGIGA
ncbi:MAG: sigma-54 dependent transcriptional regulator [Planctomycetota bacterium]|nr:sigma-54 dependent transcriptional regulator [Planctomycetota bacterium]